MPKTKDVVDTTLRLPRDLHSTLKDAASRAGVTLSAEIIFRLQRDPRDEYAQALLAEIKARDRSVEEGLSKQLEVTWTALERADEVLANVERAMALVSPDSDRASLKRDVEFARQLIAALGAHR